MCALKRKVKTLGIENKFLRNDEVKFNRFFNGI